MNVSGDAVFVSDDTGDSCTFYRNYAWENRHRFHGEVKTFTPKLQLICIFGRSYCFDGKIFTYSFRILLWDVTSFATYAGFDYYCYEYEKIYQKNRNIQ